MRGKLGWVAKELRAVGWEQRENKRRVKVNKPAGLHDSLGYFRSGFIVDTETRFVAGPVLHVERGSEASGWSGGTDDFLGVACEGLFAPFYTDPAGSAQDPRDPGGCVAPQPSAIPPGTQRYQPAPAILHQLKAALVASLTIYDNTGTLQVEWKKRRKGGMQNCRKVKGHRPVKCSDGTETAQLQAESWDAAQKFNVQSSVIAGDPTGSQSWKRLEKYVEFIVLWVRSKQYTGRSSNNYMTTEKHRKEILPEALHQKNSNCSKSCFDHSEKATIDHSAKATEY
ncbi:hypothetical protein DUI87_07299 [Hirundo rustica rustica]|uniref:Uncharacterized protein n=1 Tax=Hirundo rustica rustica TaxID=333673 RepID=A0A3M0KPJ7_HIRRU|nr:hypothetical protein DUI87_07299 [Hirundo rustica rustica]